MPLKLTGGSITLSVAATAILWTLRSLRYNRRRKNNLSLPLDSRSKYFAELSLETIALLVHLQSIPYYFIDVRTPEEAAAAPLAHWVTPAVNIPEPQLQAGLKQPTAWYSYAAAALNKASAPANTAASTGTPADPTQQEAVLLPPSHRHFLVILSSSNQQQQLACSRAAAAGFDRVAVPACGLDQFLHVFLPNTPISRDEQVLSAAAAAAEQWPEIHADALAVLLGIVTLPDGVWQLFNQQNPSLIPSQNPGSTAQQQQQRSPGHTRSNSSSSLHAAAGEAGLGEASAAAAARQQRLLLLDVRRHDERTLYGAIPGALHIPVDELASAMALPAGAFRRRYHFDPPRKSLDVLVLHSRASSRAQWAAQTCLDAGCAFVFVYPAGVLGWFFGPGVDSYAAYQQGEKPPEPDERTLREPDVAAGVMELQQLGLVGLLMQQHGVVASR